MSSIPLLTVSNYVQLNQQLKLLLGCMGLDKALIGTRPAALTPTSTAAEKTACEKWERSNRMSKMMMQATISPSIRGTIPEDKNANEYLEAIGDRFTTSNKVEAISVLSKLITIRYKGKGNIREYVIEMENLVAKLKGFKIDISDDMLVMIILLSLLSQYGQLKVSYNTQKEKWGVTELTSQLAREEERLKQDRTYNAHLVTTSKGKGPNKKAKKSKPEAVKTGTAPPPLKNDQNGKDPMCYFCKKRGQLKPDCAKFAAWLAKKNRAGPSTNAK